MPKGENLGGQASEGVVLKACPFCGATDAFSEQADLSSGYIVCNNCLARGPVECQSGDDEEEPGRENAIAAWNARTRHPSGDTGEIVRELRQLAMDAPDPRPMSAAMFKAADRIEQQAATIAELTGGLETVRRGAKLGRQMFDRRMGEHKNRLTWHAVNVLQDNLAACEGAASATLERTKQP